MLRFLKLFYLCLLAVSLMALPAVANDDDAAYEAAGVAVWKMLPRPSEMIRHPSAQSYEFYGNRAQPKTVKADELPAGEAVQIKIRSAGKNPWDVGANIPTQMATQKGDVLVAVIFARASKLPKGQATASLPIHIQEQGGDYQQYGSETVQLTTKWQQYTVYGTLDRDYKAGKVGAAVHLATGKQMIELGPIYIMNMGQGAVDPADMPNNGRSPVAAVKPVAATLQTGAVPEILRGDYAALEQQLPTSGTLMNSPLVSAGAIFGENVTGQVVSDAGVPGGEAIEIAVSKPGLNSWSSGVNWATTGQINPDDTVLLAYWAKGISAKNESQTPAITPARVQQSGEPYASAAVGSAYLSRDWQMYYAGGRATDVIAPGGSGISFHLGLTAQKMRLGPAYVINLGKGADPYGLPQTKVTYDGRAIDAPWRAKAMRKIDQHRKANLTIRVTDDSGQPRANVPVKVAMTKHKFHFGTFVNHKFLTPETEEERRWHQTFDENFNTATLPLYWQDWGWNGDKAQDYRETVKYTAGRNIPWRGHPILWPGENYMPSYIKETKSAKKQREQALEHVRDVMSFVAPYKPFAIDMVNEVRVNQYFKENGNADLVAESFKLAHSIAPDIPLFVNDYAVLNNGGLNSGAIEFYHDWIRDMRGQAVPVGGIGFQSHFSAGLTPPSRIMEILGEFGDYGLPMHVTEFDIETLDEQAQADYTRDFIIAAFSEPQMEAFIMWGFYEGSHWKAPAAMVREDWSKKPNYDAWRKVVFDTLWTDETVMTDANGVAKLRGFKGDYDLSVEGRVMSVQLSADQDVAFKP